MNYHNTYDYIIDPQHKITVALIGCGGTGTQVLSILARMNIALMGLGHEGLHVTLFDDDKVSEANIGRQLFSESEIGQLKSVALASRFNRFYGTKWEAFNHKFGEGQGEESVKFNIYITCVDSFEARMSIGKKIHSIKKNRDHDLWMFYWLDFGNTNNTGQAILGTLWHTPVEMPTFDKWAAQYKKPKEEPNVPSCSLAEALEKQDLLINSFLANAGMQLLWNIFREGGTSYQGVMVNLKTLTTNPIKIQHGNK